jgi:hypothetical protein
LFPLAKGRAGEDAPPFAIELVYALRDPDWMDKGAVTLALPVLDLPVSRTGMMLYFPPLYRLDVSPGAFRVQPYELPVSDALRGEPQAPTSRLEAQVAANMRVNGLPLPLLSVSRDPLAVTSLTAGVASSTQALVDNYRNRAGARRAFESLPARVTFPSVGPSVFFASELTGEGKPAVLQFEYQKDKKGGVR